MIYFFSNHKDMGSLERLTGEKVQRIPHPLLLPEWSEAEALEKCAAVIRAAMEAPDKKLVLNGDYWLVDYIVNERRKQGKRSGFIAFRKVNKPDGVRAGGQVQYTNILEPVKVRWNEL